ncbi:LLM class flavin-dependent oxidoreductase, partial [Aeromicrobium sp.]|uniref:LLM class flavin-dependent oxidoreductase n=1 Tax=Aeromicrobium sp. TaxID=1871063 RepID=UPI0028B16B47
PGRLTVALGSGQALNEHVTGDPWPAKPERNARLAECADVISRLLDGERVDHRGAVRVDRTRLYTPPADRPRLFAAAMTPETAAEVAAWADGLITVNASWDHLRRVIDAFRDGGGGDRPVHVQVHVSWDPDPAVARNQAVAEWSMAALPPPPTQDLATPADIEAATAGVTADDLSDSVVIASDLDEHVEWLCRCAALGVERIYVHQVGRDQAGFVSAFGEHVLPRVRARVGGP